MLPQFSVAHLELARCLDLLPAFAAVLANAGLSDPERARQFLQPRLRDLRDPFELNGVRSAVDRIFRAIDEQQRIVLYGDYDVDGVASVAMLCRILRCFSAEVKNFLPRRIDEGYGLSKEGVGRCLATHNPVLLIALDCGTASADRIQEINSLGIDVIVVDHHEAQSGRPNCCALINPKLGLSDHYFCTAGLVFKLCHALLKTRRLPDVDLKSYLDLVALATVADLVPLIDENRILVQHGLRQLEQTEWIGLRALKKVAGICAPIRAVHVGYGLGPRLNAAGRVGVAQNALELLLTDDPIRAQALATELDSQNRDRQFVEQKTFDEASKQLASTFLQERDAAIVVGAKGWHPGVVGIVASRLSKQFHRPTLVIGFDESGDGRGSGRSVPGLSLIKALDECSEFLIQFGGHEMAGGVRLSMLQLEAFSEAFRAVAQRMLSSDLLQPRLRLAAELQSTEINFQLLRCHELMEPFGVGNPQPIFYIRRVVPASEPKLLKDKHWLFPLRPASPEGPARQFEAIYFNGASVPLPSPPWDVAFYVQAKYHENRVQVQLQVEAIRTANE